MTAASRTSAKAAAKKAERQISNKGQAALEKLGVTLGQLGAATEKSRQVASKWMQGTARPDTGARQAIFVRWPSVTPDLWDISSTTSPAKKTRKAAPKVVDDGTDFRAKYLAHAQVIEGHLQQAIAEGKPAEVQKLLSLKARVLMDGARFSGELSALDEAKLTSSARFVAVRTAIARALVPYPDAAKAVEEALRRLDA